MADDEVPALDRMVDNKVLIKEIKKRHCLYDKHNKEYTNAPLKHIKWREVTQIVFTKYWNNWISPVKDRAVEFCIKRWSNLRNCFLRELRRTATYVEKGYKVRRQYIYFNELVFLKDHIEKKEQYDVSLRLLEANGNIKTEEESDQDDDNDDEQEQTEEEGDDGDCQIYEEYLDEELVQDIPSDEMKEELELPKISLKRRSEKYTDISDPLQYKKVKKNKRNISFDMPPDELMEELELPETPPKRSRESDTDISDPLQYKKAKKNNRNISFGTDRKSNISNDIQTASSPQFTLDQDMNFALSLVPLLRELSYRDKIDAQIQILKIFKAYNRTS